MKIGNIFFVLIVLFCGACSKNCESNIENLCTNKMLKEFKMVPYTGQTNYCNSLINYEFESKDYFVLDCCICDMAPNPVDCDNTSYVIINGKYDADKAEIFFAKAINKGIVGIFE
jgi:hypothetical protein